MLFANTDVSEEQIQSALVLADCNFVLSYDDGLNHQIKDSDLKPHQIV